MTRSKGRLKILIVALILLVLSGCTSDSKKEEQYVQRMLDIVKEIDSEMKELSRSGFESISWTYFSRDC